MSRFHPLDLDLDDAQLIAIGRFAAQWAFFETEMTFTISALGMLVEGDRNMPHRFNEQLQRWRKLARAYYSTPDVRAACERLIDTAKAAHQARSTLAHGRIIGDPKRRLRRITVTQHRHLSSGWQVNSATFTPRHIEVVAKAIGTLSNDLIRFNHLFLAATPRSLPRRFL